MMTMIKTAALFLACLLCATTTVAQAGAFSVQPVRLFFGERPRDNDMCTPDRRPAALFPHPLLRATAQ